MHREGGVINMRWGLLPVSVKKKNAPPEKNTLEHISFKNTKSRAGEQFLPLDRRARACAEGVCISQAPILLQLLSSLLLSLVVVVVVVVVIIIILIIVIIIKQHNNSNIDNNENNNK